MNGHSAAELDVLVVGAGFSGLHFLYNLRKKGLNVKCFERGEDIGGTWHQHRYPGARVDSAFPIYQFSDKRIWEVWNWRERFPGYGELREYFDHVDSVWDVRKDIVFKREVIAAEFDETTAKWLVRCSDGSTVRTRWFIAAVGFSAKRYVPPFAGLDAFSGQWYHTGSWPEHEVDFKGKRVAVIGTGASGVQVIQEIADQVEHLTVYQRTPNTALPMRQRTMDVEAMNATKASGDMEKVFEKIRTSPVGMEFYGKDCNTADEPEDVRRAYFEEQWSKGGFAFMVDGYKDSGTDQAANDIAYAFWAEKTRERITDPKKKDILAPLKQPHPIGAKRCSLEQDYYKKLNLTHVDIIDVSTDPIVTISEAGIRTQNTEVDVDIIVVATGYDSATGSITQMNIKGADGISIGERWGKYAKSYLGLSIAHYPNFFYTYGFQAPTAISNGPTCIEIQAEWIEQLICEMEDRGVARIEPTVEAQEKYTKTVDSIWASTLFPKANSWWQGSNIPGKPVQALNWLGGVPIYAAELYSCRDKGYEGFVISKC